MFVEQPRLHRELSNIAHDVLQDGATFLGSEERGGDDSNCGLRAHNRAPGSYHRASRATTTNEAIRTSKGRASRTLRT